MADKLRLGTEVRELKIGQSFTNTKSGAFHAVRYDFKPASVDINKMATVDIGNSNQVTVNVPHLDGAGVPQTVFKGSHRPFTKECVLIFDRITGEITLEKLSSNIQVKKTRSETTKPILPQDRGDRSTNSIQSSSTDRNTLSASSSRPQTPPIGQRQSNKTRVTSGSRRPDRQITQLVSKHSPLRASPNYSSPGHSIIHTTKSPKRNDRLANGDNDSTSHCTLGSLPMIGIDDFVDDVPPVIVPSTQNESSTTTTATMPITSANFQANSHSNLSSQSDSEDGAVLEMSDSSSSESSSDSDSERDDPNVGKNSKRIPVNGGHSVGNGSVNGGGASAKLPSLPTTLLNEDLCLSESGSDFDDD